MLSVVVGSDSVVVDSVVVSSDVVSSSVVVDSLVDSVDVGVDSVVVSVAVESESTASGPAPATTPDVKSPAVNIATSTNTTRSRCRLRESAVRRSFISPNPLVKRRRSGVPAPHSHRSRLLTRSQRCAVLTSPPVGLGVRCYNLPPADGESALFL